MSIHVKPPIMSDKLWCYYGQYLTNQHYLSIIDALCVIMLIIGE